MTGICQGPSVVYADDSVTTCLLNELVESGVYTSPVTAKSIGSEIKRLRGLRNWKLPEFARRSGVDKTSINRIERGTRKPQRSTLKSIVLGLGLKPYETDNPRLLEALNDSAGSGGAGGSTRPTDRLREFVDYISTLEGKERSDFLNAIAAVLDVAGHTRAATGTGTTTNDGH